MQKRLAIGRGVKILDQKNRGGGSTNPHPAILRVKIVNPTITTLFYITLNILRSHQADLLGSWRVHAHPTHPLPTGLGL